MADLQEKMDEFIEKLYEKCKVRPNFLGLSGGQLGPATFVIFIETTEGKEAYYMRPLHGEWRVMYGYF